jgi:hypothetical protein
MQLDRTFIAIRPRSVMERWDLTLQVVRKYFRPICILFAIGIVPWMILNHLLTMWMVSRDFYVDHLGWFYWVNFCLVVSQAQVGTCWISLWEAMFEKQPSIRGTIRGASKAGFWFWWMHLVNRMVLPCIGCAAMLIFVEDESSLILFGGFLIGAFLSIGVLVRSATPYMNEVVLLEKAPRKSDSESQLSYSVRSALLRAAPGADFFGKLLASLLVGAFLIFAIYETLCFVDQILNLQSLASQNLNYIYWQFSIWIAASVIAVNRFLSYIDLRIRTEGWAVRLRLIAENKRQLAGTVIG